MRKRTRARRLWLGDWQHNDAEPTDAQPVAGKAGQDDTFVILPDDEGDAESRAGRRRNVQRGVAILAAIAVLFALGSALSSRGDENRRTSPRPQVPSTQTPQVQPQAPQPAGPPGFGGPDLTGAAATKAAEAALARYPGAIERVTAGPGGAGGYVVHVIQPDGDEVHVIVSDEFKVLGSDAGRGAPPSGPTPQSDPTNPS